MFLESFRHLIEIEALKKQNQQNLLQISSETKRISDLSDRRMKTLAQIDDFILQEKNLKLTDTQQQIDLLNIRLTKLNSQLGLAVTEKEQLAFESQIKLIKNEINILETLYFSNLETSESIQINILDNNKFLEGSLESLEIIKTEVEKNISIEQRIIENRNLRIQSLTELLHPSVKSLYWELEKRFKPKSPVAYLIDKKCSECHMLADSLLKNSLEEGRSIEACPSCSRLLIPETAKIY
jgi:predicted  nucleic acid-binding Zn-ribbon protein